MSTGGLSKTRLDRMHDIMSGYVERGEAPGIVTLVSRRGGVHADVIGTTAAVGSDPIRRDTIFPHHLHGQAASNEDMKEKERT